MVVAVMMWVLSRHAKKRARRDGDDHVPYDGQENRSAVREQYENEVGRIREAT